VFDGYRGKRQAGKPDLLRSPRLFSARLGRGGESLRINARQGDAGRLADSGVAVALRLLERGDGVLRFFAKVAKPDGGAPAHVPLLVLQGLDQRRHDPRRVPLALGQETNCFDPVSLLGRLQIRDQLVGRFLLLAAPTCQQAKQQNKTCLHAHSLAPPSNERLSEKGTGTLRFSLQVLIPFKNPGVLSPF